MKKVRKIYEYKNVLTDPCKWCDGTGRVMGSWHSKTCDMCKGTGGKWERIKVLIREEVIE